MFPEKGKRGYLRGKKIKNLLIALLLAAVILAFLLIGFFLNGDTKNIYTIMAVLTALPFANLITVYIAVFPYSAPSQEEYDQVAAAAGEGLFETELAVTGANLKTLYLSYAFVAEGMILAYAPDKGVEPKKYEDYISGMMASNGCQMHVKIFTQLTPFIKRVRDVKHISREQADDGLLQAEKVLKSIAI
jgi:hypothetical protein